MELMAFLLLIFQVCNESILTRSIHRNALALTVFYITLLCISGDTNEPFINLASLIFFLSRRLKLEFKAVNVMTIMYLFACTTTIQITPLETRILRFASIMYHIYLFIAVLNIH